MTVSGPAFRLSPALRALAVFVFAASVIGARRWPQLLSPDVWVEDGTLVIPGFARHGWASLFEPVAGYLVVPGKMISFVSLTLTFDRYALVATVLAIAVQAAVVATIAVAPTILSGPLLAAILVPLLPIGSEVFALPSYTFWWTTLLVFVGLFWRDGERLAPRLGAIAIGGLSSPFVVAACPIFALRAALSRTRGNIAALVVAVAAAAVQGSFMVREHASGVTPLDARHHIPELISKYFGAALYSLGQHGAGPFGALVLVFLFAGLFVVPQPRRPVYLLLGLCLGAAIVSSVSRVSVSAPHPLLAGPRYFFFPLILTGWMLIMLVREAPRRVGMAAMVIAGAYIPSFAAALTFEPQVPKEPWTDQVAACESAEADYTFDIQYGLPQVHWSSTLSGDECRALQAGAYFDRHSPDGGETAPAGVP